MILILLAITSLGRLSYAEEMSMDAFQKKFEQETGKTWASATSEEKLDFVNGQQKIYQQKPEKIREQLPEPAERSSGLLREVNVAVRKQFLEETRKAWEEGTAQEQETFLNKYKERMRKEALKEGQKERAAEALERTKQREKDAELRAKQKAIRVDEKQKRDKKRALEEKKRVERKKLEDTARKFKQMREKFRQKR